MLIIMLTGVVNSFCTVAPGYRDEERQQEILDAIAKNPDSWAAIICQGQDRVSVKAIICMEILNTPNGWNIYGRAINKNCKKYLEDYTKV